MKSMYQPDASRWPADGHLRAFPLAYSINRRVVVHLLYTRLRAWQHLPGIGTFWAVHLLWYLYKRAAAAGGLLPRARADVYLLQNVSFAVHNVQINSVNMYMGESTGTIFIVHDL